MLLDYSEVMLEEASRRLAHLAGRVRLVQGDLSAPGAVARAAGEGDPDGVPDGVPDGAPFDAVVSSLCIHNLRPTERVPALFGEVRAALAPGGASWTSTSWAARPCSSAPGTASRSSACAPSATPGPVTRPPGRRLRWSCWLRASAAPDAPPRAPAPRRADGAALTRTLADHLLWLRQAGFDAVDCFWRQERHAIVGGFVAPTA